MCSSIDEHVGPSAQESETEEESDRSLDIMDGENKAFQMHIWEDAEAKFIEKL